MKSLTERADGTAYRERVVHKIPLALPPLMAEVDGYYRTSASCTRCEPSLLSRLFGRQEWVVYEEFRKPPPPHSIPKEIIDRAFIEAFIKSYESKHPMKTRPTALIERLAQFAGKGPAIATCIDRQEADDLVIHINKLEANQEKPGCAKSLTDVGLEMMSKDSLIILYKNTVKIYGEEMAKLRTDPNAPFAREVHRLEGELSEAKQTIAHQDATIEDQAECINRQAVMITRLSGNLPPPKPAPKVYSVRINKARLGSFWYAGMIGWVIPVLDEYPTDWLVKNNGHLCQIEKSDCEPWCTSDTLERKA